MLDRIDLHITVPALPISDLQNAQAGETSKQVRSRVAAAHERQLKRQQKVNNELSPNEIDKYIQLSEGEQQLLQLAQQRLNLSARGYHRVLRVARTIADLASSTEVTSSHCLKPSATEVNHEVKNHCSLSLWVESNSW